MSTLGTQPVLRIRTLHIPPAGGFFADLTLDSPTLPALGPAMLTIFDLQLLGTVTVRGFDDHPQGGAAARVTLEGGAGWNTPLTQRGEYSVASGVRLSTVLRDLAGQAGEGYVAPTDALLPPIYRWAASTPREPVTGRAVLADLLTRGAISTWRVDPSTGLTRFDPWPLIGAADAVGRVLTRNISRRRRTVGLDKRVAAFLPGSTVEGVITRRLMLTESAAKLQVEVFGI